MFIEAIDSIRTFKGNLNPKDTAYRSAISVRNNLLKSMAEFILKSSEEKWVIENRLQQIDDQVKSRQRVVDLAEVLTNPREVEAMIKLVNHSQYEKDKYTDPESYYLSFQPLSTWLEPAVGDGNFLVVLLSHKLSRNAYDFLLEISRSKTKAKKEKSVSDLHFNIIKSVSSIYAVDIDRSNVDKSRNRMLEMIKTFYANLSESNSIIKSAELPENIINIIAAILQRNIILGNTIEDDPHQPLNTHKMHVVEYKFDDTNYTISMRTFSYAELAKPDFSPAFRIDASFTGEIIQNITHLKTINSILAKNGMAKIVNMRSTTKDTVLEEIKDIAALAKEAEKKKIMEEKRKEREAAKLKEKQAKLEKDTQDGVLLF